VQNIAQKTKIILSTKCDMKSFQSVDFFMSARITIVSANVIKVKTIKVAKAALKELFTLPKSDIAAAKGTNDKPRAKNSSSDFARFLYFCAAFITLYLSINVTHKTITVIPTFNIALIKSTCDFEEVR